MEKTVFSSVMEGLTIDRVVRDHEYTMPSRHFHESCELYFLLEGERYYFIDRETYLVKSGMMVLVRKGQIHKTSMAGSSYHDRILLQLKEEVFDETAGFAGLPALDRLFEENYGVIDLSKEDQERVIRLLLDIQKELEQRQSRYQAVVRLKVAELLVLVYRRRRTAGFSREARKAQTSKHQKVHEVADYLLNHCDTEESLEELAGRFYISKTYLCRIFKQVTGFTVNEYLNLTRIKKAQKLLLKSEYSVTEIAAMTGYDSITYFERVFRKLTDSTPLQYRKGR